MENVVKVLSLKVGTGQKLNTSNLMLFKKHDYMKKRKKKKKFKRLSFLWSSTESQACYKLPQQSKQTIMIQSGNTVGQRKHDSTQNTNKSK